MKLKFTLILLGFFCMTAMKAMSVAKMDVPPNSTEITLNGDFANGFGPDTVEAYYNQNMVVVCFHQNFGYVSILLIGGINTIYEGTVNTAVQQTVYIPIAGAPSGTYTLILNNANGGFEGDFEN